MLFSPSESDQPRRGQATASYPANLANLLRFAVCVDFLSFFFSFSGLKLGSGAGLGVPRTRLELELESAGEHDLLASMVCAVPEDFGGAVAASAGQAAAMVM